MLDIITYGVNMRNSNFNIVQPCRVFLGGKIQLNQLMKAILYPKDKRRQKNKKKEEEVSLLSVCIRYSSNINLRVNDRLARTPLGGFFSPKLGAPIFFSGFIVAILQK